MLYIIDKSIYNNFDIIDDNKLAERSYFIPFKSVDEMQKTTYLDERYSSSMVDVLNGEWDFKYYAHSNELPENFDPAKVTFDQVNVPCTWQRTGYDQIAYINTRYAFKKDPPHIPHDLPVGVYRKSFNVTGDGKRIITFLGVANNLSLYINGQYVGYGEGSHNSYEYDITSFVHEGENELVAVVFKWCNGSYLECQDMFRENGIFRDVYITTYSESYIYDFGARALKADDGTYSLTLTTDGEFCTDIKILASVKGEGIDREVELQPNGAVTIDGLEPREWTAETPNLYEVIVTLESEGEVLECIRQYIGFKDIKIDGEVFRFNGANIKMKGVNHHDTDPVGGYVMSVDDLLRDIKLMKEYNVNTVRTSHYPPDPIMLTMCDFYGLYVVDEADIETHGFYAVPYTTNNPNRLSNDETWRDHYLDRVRRMYGRDKNHPSITMWSLGNEAGGHKCQDYCNDYLKKVSPEIPVHYEGVIRSDRWAYDVVSHMYASHDLMRGIMEDRKGLRDIMGGKAGDKYKGKPFFQCEYAHAMGVGPGGLEDYMQLFYQSDQFMGGCIWEWADHSVYDENYKWKWTYGGDHDEPIHDGNFCVDGLFFPDRTPSSGALNMKAVYRPIRTTYVGDSTFELFNTNAFLDSSYIDISYVILVDGVETKRGTVDTVVPAWSKAKVSIDTAVEGDGEVYIKFTYRDKKSGALIAEDGEMLRECIRANKLSALAPVTRKNKNIEATFDGGKVVFDKSTGEMTSYVYNGVEYIDNAPHDGYKGFTPKVYRGEIDNERFTKIFWMINGLSDAKEHKTSVKVKSKDGITRVIVHYDIITRLLFVLATVKVVYTIDKQGKIRVDATLSKVNPFLRTMPKFGLAIELNKEMDKIKYYGRGNTENLADFNAHALMGIYDTTVSEMPMDYIKPQDSGNRCDVRWAEFTNDKGEGVKISAVDKAFNLNANNYSYNTLRKAGHMEDLGARDANYVYIDGFVRGSGTNSCGPSVQAPYVVKVGYRAPLSYSFTIEPIRK